MTPEERKAVEFAEKKRLEALREVQEREEIMKRIQQESMADRMEKLKEKAKPSIANPLSFGANIQKFKPPEP